MRAALLCAYSAEKLFIIEQCRAVCGPPGIAFSRVGVVAANGICGAAFCESTAQKTGKPDVLPRSHPFL